MKKYYGYVIFIIAFVIYLIKSFLLNKNLGFGLGDLVFHIAFFGLAIIGTVLYVVSRRQKSGDSVFQIFSHTLAVISLYLIYILTIGEGPEGGW